MSDGVKLTVGEGVRTSRGVEINFTSWREALENMEPTKERWFSPHLWAGGQRSKRNWRQGCAAVVDVDYHNEAGEHAAPPPEAVEALLHAPLRCNFLYLTPRGARLIYEFSKPISDRLKMLSALQAACDDAELSLQGVPGYRPDRKASLDLARLFFAPNAIVNGIPRNAKVVHVRKTSWTSPLSSGYAESALQGEIERVRNTPPGGGKDSGRNNALNRAAFSLGQLVGAGLLERAHVEAELRQAASQAGLRNGEIGPTILSGLNAGERTPRKVQSSPELKRERGWTHRLIQKENADGTLSPLRCTENVETILEYDDRWKGVLAFDEFAQKCVTLKEPPWCLDDGKGRPWKKGQPWTDTDDTLLEIWLGRHFGLRPGILAVARAAQAVMERNRIHPVQDYLRALTWDREPRLETWLAKYLGVEDTPYVRLVGRWWLTSAVARMLRPGCKADHVLIIEGPQGRRKSTALATLFGEEWFTDNVSDLGSTQTCLQIQGAWCIELAELDAFSRAESSKAKEFFARKRDRFRPPYGRRVIELPRQCVFAGTVNLDAYLKDATGNRRYWPVKCGEVDIELLKRDRDQIWAETIVWFKDGAEWWPVRPDEVKALQKQQEDRYQKDEWEDMIANWLYTRGSTAPLTTEEVACDGLSIEKSRIDMICQKRIANALRRLGYKRSQRTVGGVIRRCFIEESKNDEGE